MMKRLPFLTALVPPAAAAAATGADAYHALLPVITAIVPATLGAEGERLRRGPAARPAARHSELRDDRRATCGESTRARFDSVP